MTAVVSHYAWSAEIVIPAQGLHDARGAHRAARPATEGELKTAIARDVAAEHGCDPTEIVFTGFTYSEIT